MAHRIPLSEYRAEHIAIIKPSALGDIVHSLPVLSALRERYPGASITWIVNRGYEPLLKGHPDLTATLPFDRKAISRGWLASAAYYRNFLAKVRQERFDLVIDLQGLLRSGLMAAYSGAPRRVGLSTAREGATFAYTDVVRVADFHAIHAVDRYWLIVQALVPSPRPKRFHVPVPQAERSAVAELLGDSPRPWIVLGVGSRWVTKRWLTEHFAALAQRAQDRFGGTMIFIGTADEASLSTEVACRLNGPVLDFTGKTSLPRLAAILEACDVMVANDTGPLHLAAALGRPVVAPFTCTLIKLNGPYGASDQAVETGIWCKGSYLKRCPRLDCMRDLTPDHLWPVLEGVLGTWQQNRQSA